MRSPHKVRTMTTTGSIAVLALAVTVALMGACTGGGGASAQPSAGEESTWERIQRTGVVRVGFANEIPWAYADSSGQLVGQAPDTLKAALAEYGDFEYEGVLTEFGALIPGLLADRFDIIGAGMFINPERCEQIDFANPDAVSHAGLAVKAGNPLDLHSYADIAEAGIKIAVLRGAVEPGYAADAGIPDDNLLLVPDDQTGLSALEAGRVDAFADNAPTLSQLIASGEFSSIELAQPFEDPLGADGQPTAAYAAMGFRTDDTDFRDAYNAGLAEAVGAGALDPILSTYGLPSDALPTAGTPTTAEICGG